MKISIEKIKELRELTGISIADCKAALEETKGDLKKAQEILRQKGIEEAEKKSERVVGQGLVETYVHANGKIASMVEVACETDFVARTPDFKNLTHEIAMQVCAMDPGSVDELLHQEYIRDNEQTIGDLVKETISKLGENIQIKRFIRFELGQ
ncbi:translation elongation factor Ts [Candidatus Curtissbacteria bacterium RBG_16_39_7]|uniref:Elongation factor Ts n=1 Tax=Candidatus Curtissbacteria bacterium RBG_16_39_7 TaxID=1797707 RepID=A0A1F5G1T1_9BACT|nr:MAG: translation elongation factor Ts [Candidatus Curtissbacteria bacterium RBG_16_39_7]